MERRGTLEFLQPYGYADRRRKIRNTPDTRFEMASLTKPFTAAAILKLQEQGKLRTSDRLDRYIGPLNPPKNLATIHHLALHRPVGDSNPCYRCERAAGLFLYAKEN